MNFNFFERNINKKEENPKLEELRKMLQSYHDQSGLNINLSDYKTDNLKSYAKQIIEDENQWKEDHEGIKRFFLNGGIVDPVVFRQKLRDALEETILEDHGLTGE